MDGTWQPAFGETRKMLRQEVLGRLIDVLLVLRDFFTLNGELSASSFSSRTMLRIGRSLSGLIESPFTRGPESVLSKMGVIMLCLTLHLAAWSCWSTWNRLELEDRLLC